MDFFHTTEFYVILFVVAASAVALVARPGVSGPVREILLAGRLGFDDDSVPGIELETDCEGNLYVIRRGISGLTSSGAVSLKVEVKGFDITVYERLTAGNPADDSVNKAEFIFDFLAQERYHFHYESESTSLSVSFNFRNVPGFFTSRDLVR